MKLVMDAPPIATPYTINFDFSTDDQRTILGELQASGYKLCGFKGASGPSQVGAGLPAWFVEPFSDMFGDVTIDYEPLYKVFAFNQAVIGANTTIKMQSLSGEVPLGSVLLFNQDGSFTTGTAAPQPGSIVVQNGTASGTPKLTIGLAAKVGGQYLPFCAFTSSPQGSIAMTPHETVCLFAAQTNLVSGTVTAAAAAPGCSFEFSNILMDYALKIAPSTFQTISAGKSVVTLIDSGTNLNQLLNQ
jgi:hypothetical protein